MVLKEFVEKFVERSSLIRLVKKTKTGHEVIGDDWDDVLMEHELINGTSKLKFQKYINCQVFGVTDILVFRDNHREAINICIEEEKELPVNTVKSDTHRQIEGLENRLFKLVVRYREITDNEEVWIKNFRIFEEVQGITKEIILPDLVEIVKNNPKPALVTKDDFKRAVEELTTPTPEEVGF